MDGKLAARTIYSEDSGTVYKEKSIATNGRV
jgi:hypothetical protein